MPPSEPMLNRRQARRVARVFKGAYLAALAALVAACLMLPIPNLLARLAPDDGFYYLEIARNASRLGRVTFDGINWTNGFHPLWGWLLMGLLAPFDGFGPEALFRYVMVVNAFLLAGAGWVFCHAWRRWMPQAWTVGLPVYAGLVFLSYCHLMETALVMLAAALVLQWLGRQLTHPRDTAQSWAGLGVLLALLGLARMDMAFLGLAVIGAAMLDLKRRDGLAAAMRLGGVAAATAAVPLGLWLVHTRASTGHWSTISSQLKLTLSDPHFQSAYLTGLWGVPGTGSLALSLLVVAAWAVWRMRTCEPVPGWANLLVVLGVSNVAFALFEVFFVNGAFAWAVVHFRLIAAGVAIVAAHWALTRSPGRIVSAVVVAAVLLAGLVPGAGLVRRLADRASVDTAWTPRAYEAARWARANLPADSVCAAKDAGVFAWFSGLPTVNLDGLVNSWDYQDALRDERHLDFLRACGVTHLFQHNVEPEGLHGAHRFWFKSNYHDHEAEPLYLQPADIVYRSDAFQQGGAPAHFVIWRHNGGG